MPRGKYVNHKGRSRHFTSPEELQQETEKTSSEEEESGSEDDDAAGASTSKPKQKKEIKNKAEDSDDDDDSDEEDEDSDDDDRGARKGVAGLIEIENPNRAVKKTAQKVTKLSLEDKEETKPELSRREREQIEKQKARMRYEKLHAAGKTSEAKSDLARLAIIRQQRAEAAAKREAEKKAQETKKPGTASGGKA